MALYLTRKWQEYIWIGCDEITRGIKDSMLNEGLHVSLEKISGQVLTLALSGAREIKILRGEILGRYENNREIPINPSGLVITRFIGQGFSIYIPPEKEVEGLNAFLTQGIWIQIAETYYEKAKIRISCDQSIGILRDELKRRAS